MSTSIPILVVDDEEAIQWTLNDYLSDGGYTVSVANSEEEAIALLNVIGSKLRALLTDINLAPNKLTGWDVARHAREINESIPVIYMTGGSAHEWNIQGVPNSFLLTKQFAPAQAVTALSQLLNSPPRLHCPRRSRLKLPPPVATYL